jgi:hypothetical protein
MKYEVYITQGVDVLCKQIARPSGRLDLPSSLSLQIVPSNDEISPP